MDVVVGWIKLRPGFREAFMAHVPAYLEATRAEPGCLFCEMTPTEQADMVIMVEAFTDAQAHATHVVSPHEKAAVAALNELAVEGRFENISADGSRLDVLQFPLAG